MAPELRSGVRLSALAALIAVACGPGGSSGPMPTPQGTATGPAVTAMVGPQGGRLISADGRFELVVPAGALGATVELSMTPITNEAPLGHGAGVRLAPDGTVFTAPAQ